MSLLIHRPIACLVLAGGIFITLSVRADSGPELESQSAILKPSDRSATEVLEHQASRAELWGLEDAEWQRYRTLMQGIRGSVSPPSLSPIEVLGIHARNNSERRRYAEQWARMMREDTERILAFQRAYDEAQQRLYPDSVRIDPRALAAEASAMDLAGTFSLEPGDRILFFTGTHCAGCDAVLERMLARIHQFSGLDLYLVDVEAGEEGRIREWAAARQIDPQWVREHRITLNIDAGALERVLAHTGLSDTDLPVLVRKRGNQLTPLPKSRFWSMSGMSLPGCMGRLILWTVCLAGTPLFAAPVVIHDSGQTRPLAPLLEPLRSDDMQADGSDPRSPSRPDPTPAPVPDETILARLLPVRSPGLQVGALTDTERSPEVQTRLAQSNPRPFFMVGSDAISRHWLAANAKTLKDLGALGLLVQAESRADIQRVIEAAQGLSITPGSGSDLARVLGIRHYPVLITRDGITQ